MEFIRPTFYSTFFKAIRNDEEKSRNFYFFLLGFILSAGVATAMVLLLYYGILKEDRTMFWIFATVLYGASIGMLYYLFHDMLPLVNKARLEVRGASWLPRWLADYLHRRRTIAVSYHRLPRRTSSLDTPDKDFIVIDIDHNEGPPPYRSRESLVGAVGGEEIEPLLEGAVGGEEIVPPYEEAIRGEEIALADIHEEPRMSHRRGSRQFESGLLYESSV